MQSCCWEASVFSTVLKRIYLLISYYSVVACDRSNQSRSPGLDLSDRVCLDKAMATRGSVSHTMASPGGQHFTFDCVRCMAWNCSSSSVTLWYFTKENELLEKVQHMFTRMLPVFRKLPYLKRSKELKLYGHWKRRELVPT